jgi:hypothetical protein
MVKRRQCGKCGGIHLPPTGNKCRKPEAEAEAAGTDEKLDQVLALVTGMQTSMESMEKRLKTVETAPADEDDASVAASTSTAEGPSGATPATLRQNPAIQATVRQRLLELHAGDEDGGTSDDDDVTTLLNIKGRGKRSGRSRTSDQRISKDIDWPHFYVYRGPEMAPAKYSDLSVQEFVAGFLASLEHSKESPAVQAKMLAHLKELMQDAADFPWASVRNFHAVLLHQFEMGRITWHDDGRIQQLRRTYAQTSRGPQAAETSKSAETSKTGPPKGQTKGPAFCLSFQRGACQHTTDHDTTRGKVRHVCAYCLKLTGNAFPHAECDCNRKAKAEPSTATPAKN